LAIPPINNVTNERKPKHKNRDSVFSVKRGCCSLIGVTLTLVGVTLSKEFVMVLRSLTTIFTATALVRLKLKFNELRLLWLVSN
jgi:hypothetical protein